VHLVSPDGQQPDIEALLRGQTDDDVYMPEVKLVGKGWVVAAQRDVPAGIRYAQPIQFGRRTSR